MSNSFKILDDPNSWVVAGESKVDGKKWSLVVVYVVYSSLDLMRQSANKKCRFSDVGISNSLL